MKQLESWRERSIPDAEEFERLLAELVRRYSPSGQEREVQRFIFDWFEARGIECRWIEKDEVVNVVAEVEGAAEGRTVLFVGHCDTVAPGAGWRTDPLRPTSEDGRLYGLGAMDMKAGLATAMLALEALSRDRHRWAGRARFVSVADEEAFSRGILAMPAEELAADGAILCEPHFRDPILRAPGKVLISVAVTGESAHGAYAGAGVNAIVEAARFVGRLRPERVPTSSEGIAGGELVLSVHGGSASYSVSVPERCEVLISRQIVPGETAQSVIDDYRALAESMGSRATFAFEARPPFYPPYSVPESSQLVQDFRRAYIAEYGLEPELGAGRSVSDANHLVAGFGVPTVVFGPGGSNMHAANEWASVAEMRQAFSLYLAFFPSSIDEAPRAGDRKGT